jgi:hypothetical protein
VCCFSHRVKTTFRAAKGDNEPLRASTTPHTEL